METRYPTDEEILALVAETMDAWRAEEEPMWDWPDELDDALRGLGLECSRPESGDLEDLIVLPDGRTVVDHGRGSPRRYSIQEPPAPTLRDQCLRAARACYAVPEDLDEEWDGRDPSLVAARAATKIPDPEHPERGPWVWEFTTWSEAGALWTHRAAALAD